MFAIKHKSFCFLVGLFISLGSFFVFPNLIHASTTVNYTVTSGTDATAETGAEFSSGDITKLVASDDSRIQSNKDSWSIGVGYDENKFIEFVFDADVPENAVIENVTISHEFRRSGALSAAKIEIWDGSEFISKDLTVGTTNVDHTDVTENLFSFIDTPDKANNLKVRFLAYRDEGSGGNTKTSHDFVGLSVAYSIEESEEPTPEPEDEQEEPQETEESEELSQDPTYITEDITENTTWTLENSPYVIQDNIKVVASVTLTIESGVVVKFDEETSLSVDGTLNALGTNSEPIYLTSIYNDARGGDTNGDGEGTAPSRYNEWGIGIYGETAQMSLLHTFVEYSDNGLRVKKGTLDLSYTTIREVHSSIYSSEGNVFFDNVLISGVDGDAFSADGGAVEIKDSIIEDVYLGDALGIYDETLLYISGLTVKNIGFGSALGIYDASAVVENSVFEGGLDSGIELYGGLLDISNSLVSGYPSDNIASYEGIFTLNKVKIENTDYGVSVYDGAVIFSGNAFKEIFVNAFENYSDFTLNAENNFWGDISGPYHEDLNPEGLGYAVYGDVLFDPWCKDEDCYIPSSEKAITAFSFLDLPIAVNGVIDEENHTIALTVPFGTDITSIVPTIEISTGASVGPNNGQNFTSPVVYTVTAEDDSAQEYTVRVAIATRTPVIIVPGLLGTEISKPTDDGSEKLWLDIIRNLVPFGDEFMDPLQFNSDLTPSETLTIENVVGKILTFDYSESLVKEFKNQGYVEGTDLFTFPYDWRYGVSEENVSKLKQKIADVLEETEAEKVDIIAHSTGGLIVKKYVVENTENHNIDKAVFVGVPNTGAPKAVKALILGDSFGVPLLDAKEMKKIAKNLPVAYDLLPSEQYFNAKGSYVKTVEQNGLTDDIPHDLDFNEINTFLTQDYQLNSQALINANNLHTADFDNYDLRANGIDLYAVNGCKTDTIGKFIKYRYQNALHPGNIQINYILDHTPGDGTVPLESATNLPINQENKFYSLNASHASMMSQDGSRQQIVNIISGSDLSTKNSKGRDLITQDISKCELNGEAMAVFSPLSIDIVDQDGNHTGLASDGVSIENNIPNASFEIIDEHKFVYLSTDEGQTYTISVAGTGTGTFTVTNATISGNNITQTQVFSDISVTPSLLGSISLSNDSDTALSLDTDGNGTTDQTLEPTSILDAIESQNFIPEEPQDNTPVVSMGGGGSISSSFYQNPSTLDQVSSTSETPVVLPSTPVVAVADVVEVPVEIPKETQVATKGNNSDTAPISQKAKSEEPVAVVPIPTENSQEEKTLTANVGDSNIPINIAVTFASVAGLTGLFWVAKFFIKV
ncbi:hypothetical protein A3H53_04800 [Candidatus Nomurabacteria bacterium RIFCSPLOWO2_02_FULL_40_10]|uniref:Uncharacterized protein n=2 Tax=Candidatus Nomuraibacteriota TaxID=1752729 RepID=A0A1F6XY39_9BACT|nr:MAG: hypothetical protein A2642_00770 [Candidatus Nomurabacteria bacterium RIFCSPHIGHO2_01_FULL_39_10]OGI99042.1 MAG: hypothetical protein A3H53_04800 [Candidatus Nomurabacteria bacterium RIFCSPLOWO2_02_FULL_40_10]